MRFFERYTVTYGRRSFALPAWVCSCGGEAFVRAPAAARPWRAAAPASLDSDGHKELRRCLDAVRTQARMLEASREPPPGHALTLVRNEGAGLISLVAVDSGGRYLAANDATCALLGYSQEDLLGLTVWDVSAPPLHPHYEQVWRKFLETGTAEGRYRLRRRTGELIAVHYASASHVLPGMHVAAMATRAMLQHL
jgi:PAS domain S-box-containing protein